MYNSKLILLIICIFLLFFGFVLFGFYSPLVTTHYTYSNNLIPASFEGYKILQISDFHCKEFGSNEENLIQAITLQKPDLIVLTGDMINQDDTDITNAEILLKAINNLCPIYSVNGNHELSNSTAYKKLQSLYKTLGIIELTDTSTRIYKDESYINLLGLGYYNKSIPLSINSLSDQIEENIINILLFHGSDTFRQLSYYHFDLIFSGHSHGGLMRLPLVGGIFGNDNTLFPEFDGGMFYENNTTLISSRGLGDAIIPRFYNNPEIVVVTLSSSP